MPARLVLAQDCLLRNTSKPQSLLASTEFKEASERKTVQDALALLVIGGAVLSTPPAAGYRHIHVGPPIVVAPPVSVPPPVVVHRLWSWLRVS